MRFLAVIPIVALLTVPGAAYAGKKKPKEEAPALVPDKPAGAAPAGAKKGDIQVTVSCATPGANMFIDGDLVGVTPIDLPIPVSPGDHSVKVTRLGFAPYIDVFTTKGKKEVRLDVELIPVSGVLHVKSNAVGARVLIDGKYVGDAPLDVEADVGPRAVQVSKVGYKEFFQNIMAVAGQEVDLDVKLDEIPMEPPPPPKWYQKGWVWGVVAAVAVVGAGAAVGAFYATKAYDPCQGTRGDIACINTMATGLTMPMP